MWLRKAAEQGLAKAQGNLGSYYANGSGVGEDWNEAIKWFRKAAEQGNAIGQNNLGSCYAKGKGVKQDWNEAAKWYRKAVEQGDAQAQFNLGNCYFNGLGVEKDDREAMKWFRKAADQGRADAQYNLGVGYENGKGRRKTNAKRCQHGICWRFSKQWRCGDAHRIQSRYLQAKMVLRYATQNWRERLLNGDIEGGVSVVMFAPSLILVSLSLRYRTVGGTRLGVEAAARWFGKAAEQGDANAQHNLGNCYAKGRGLEHHGARTGWYREGGLNQAWCC